MCSRSSRDLHQLSIVHHCQTTRVYRTDKIELVIGNLSTPTVVSLRRMDPTDPHSHGYSLSLSLIAAVGSCSSNKTDPVVIYYLLYTCLTLDITVIYNMKIQAWQSLS